MYVNSFLPAPAIPPRTSSAASLREVAAKLFSACPNAENPFFSPESVKQFKQHLVTQQLPKGAIVVLDAEVSKKLFYLRSGICRIFHYNTDDKDVTSWFISENEFFLPAVKAARVTDSLEYMEILEKAELVTLCAHQLEAMYQEHAELNLFGRLLKGQMLARCEERIRFLQIPKAQDRFRDFERQHAALPARVPLKHIASFLNLTPSTLSRLRASPGQ